MAKWLLQTAVCAALAGLVSASSVAAQDAPPSPPSTQLPRAPLSQEEVAAFKADPEELLEKHPLTGATLVARIRAAFLLSSAVNNLVLTDIETVPVLLELAKSATLEQQRAIGAGLNRAAMAYVAVRPDLATLIQEKVADSGITELQTAFLAGNIQTAAFFNAGPRSAGPGGIGGGMGPGTNFLENGVNSKGSGAFLVGGPGILFFVNNNGGGGFFDGGDDDDDNDDDSISPVTN